MFSSSSLNIFLQNSTLFSNPYTDEATPSISLRGSVALNINSTLKIKKLYLQFSGKLSMQFPGTIKKTRRDIIELAVSLLEYDKATSISGQHTFPFELLVPSDLPESLHGDYGKIKYTLKAVVETSFINFDLKTEVPVQVLRNITAQQELASECMVEDIARDSLACKVSMPTSEYIPGEKFDLQVSTLPLVDGVNVKNATCTLKEHTHFHIPSKTDQSRVYVAEYSKCLDIKSKALTNNEQVKTILLKAPEDSGYSCINSFVEVTHELVVRIYWEKDTEMDCITLSIPINIITPVGEYEFDQLPTYCMIESPPPYHKQSRFIEVETVAISLPPSYDL
ncbi:hypothetical protein K493DRAFT_389286 [Basidiobolus meristosporus CBS 931.73]|uniref:Arrestin C-terminal-like domain-containing protein n=1 Tax=Basidiobolus meristosporus CBS 931.73 TaxID=1314790 RepID=A0A1Y1ZBF1_9FUNG|nr:hypothetical protein K493DRAFT_389286 [Basidiobolus meristosporus CBS 931.73]|eukprot:ORY07643.1 hypothetical protein K493DRAFT_389286 [Basidiobolus meristosporus CBS 931.73]